MRLEDLRFVIENPSGTYKKFADSLDDYPVLGVTYPTHYGYVEGFESEDGHDLDVFIGNGNLYGILRVNRDDVPGGIETKFIVGTSKKEIEAIRKQFEPVIHELETFGLETFLDRVAFFQRA